MTTVIDSLVVELGIDPKNFSRGQQQAIDSLRNLEEESRRRSLNIESSSLRASSAISGIKTQTLELYGAIAGGSALVAFATNAIHAGAAAGRLSRNIGLSVDTITRFQNLASTFGGSAEGMATSFVAMSDALEGWKIGDVKQVIADYRALGSAGGTVIDINKGVEQTFIDLAKNLKAIHDTQGAGMAGYWQRRLGIDPGLFDAMIQKGGNFNELLQKMRGLTDAEAEAAGKLERRWNSFVNNATKVGQGFILDQVDKTLNDANDPKNYIMHWLFGSLVPKEESASPAGANSPTASGNKSWRDSIASIESRGTGGYAAVGPVTASGDRAYGRYQVMGNNIGPWSEAATGKKLSTQEFMASPAAQDAIFDYQFGKYVKQFGNPQDAASAWLTGRPLASGANLRDLNGTSGAGYAARFTEGLRAGSTVTSTTTIGTVNINAGANADGRQIGEKFVSTVKRQSFAAQANDGQN